MKPPTSVQKNLKLVAPLASLLLVAPVHAAVYTYNGSGNWSTASNWDTGSYPNAVGAVVSKTTSGNYTLTQDLATVTVGTVSLTGNSLFTISTGTNAFILDGGGTGALIENASTAASSSLIFNTGANSSFVINDNLLIKQSDAYNTSSALASTPRYAIQISQRIVGTKNITVSNVLNDLNYGLVCIGGGNTSAGIYTGAVTLSKGALTWTSSTAFGSTSGITLGSTGGGDVSFVTTGTLQGTVAANITVAANTGGKTVLGSVVSAGVNPQKYQGNITLNQDLIVISQMTDPNVYGVQIDNGVISGIGGLQINGNVTISGVSTDTVGVVKLLGNNTFTGDTRVYNGTLLLGATTGNISKALQNSTLNLAAADRGTVGFGVNSSTTINAATIGGLEGNRNLALQNINATSAAVALSVGNNNQDTVYSGTMTGIGSLIKIGTGKLALDGSNAYTGATTITGGILQIGNGGTTGALSTSSSIANNATLVINRTNAVAQGTDFSGAAITGTGQFTQAGTGTTTLNAANSFSGAVNVQNGALSFSTLAANGSAQSLGSGSTVNLGVASTSSGILNYTGAAGTFAKNVYALGNGLNTVQNSSSGLLTLSGSLVKNGTILVLNGGNGGIKVTGTISGSSANSDLYVTGGTTTLASVNTYNGPTWIYGGGILVNGITDALPTNTSIILGGTNGGTDDSSNTFDLHGFNQTVASLSSTGSGIQTVTNNGTGASLLTVTGGGSYNGVIADGNATTALTVSGGNLILGGNNTYTGATTISGGVLSVNGSLANSAVSVSNGATLSGSGSVVGTTTVSSGTVNGSGLTLGATNLSGLSTLSGHNIASSVAVTGGTTVLTGTTQTSSALTVSVGAMLNTNDGTINGSADISGVLKGNSTITSNLTLESTAKLVAEVTGATAGLTYNQVKVGGNVSLNGTLDLSTLGGLTLGNSIVLIDNTGSGMTTGYFSSILTNGSTYTFSSNNDAVFTVAGTEYLLSYNSSSEGDGQYNDVTLTVVPEPTTWAMLMGGVGMLALGQRLRRRN